MSLTSEEFFGSLEDGQQYMSIFTSEEYYNLIPEDIQREMVINEIRQTNVNFKDDPIHKNLVSNYAKAKKELRNYEYKINQENGES
jgi:hypothetical protein